MLLLWSLFLDFVKFNILTEEKEKNYNPEKKKVHISISCGHKLLSMKCPYVGMHRFGWRERQTGFIIATSYQLSSSLPKESQQKAEPKGFSQIFLDSDGFFLHFCFSYLITIATFDSWFYNDSHDLRVKTMGFFSLKGYISPLPLKFPELQLTHLHPIHATREGKISSTVTDS